VADSERELTDCVGAIYDAATDRGRWLDVGERMRRLFNASRATLRLGNGPEITANLLMPPDGSEATYAAHFHKVNPYLTRSRRDFAEARSQHLTRANVGSDLVPDESFLRSEYYRDFARLHGRRHMIGGMVGTTEATPIALFRSDREEQFSSNDVVLLQILLPHLQRALELRQRLGDNERAAGLSRAVLDALPAGVTIVDAGLRIQFANSAARAYLSKQGPGLYALRSGPFSGSSLYLTAGVREDAGTLRRIVASATSGGPGGSMRVVAGEVASVAVLVSPAPPLLVEDVTNARGGGTAEALALVVIRRLDRKAPPPGDMLCDLYGFSRAEAEVAAALSGGVSADDVARRRGVSLMTVRSQIRSILDKSECENLRDLERSMATLTALVRSER
jgi:DNA-binding NarL/FixJ family response regulator/PAS domain-containing protein